jgi:hypothetical protein
VPVIRRLSIDIDIPSSAPAETLEQSVASVASLPPFTSYKEEDSGGVRGLPNRRHFRFFYTPILPGNPAPFVLLDVVEESEVPHEVIKRPITPAILVKE